MAHTDSLEQMLRFDALHVLDEAERDAIEDFVTRIHGQLGRRPLSDQAWLELTRGGAKGLAAVVCHRGADDPAADELAGVCLIGSGRTWTMEMVVDRNDVARREIEVGLLAAARDVIAGSGGGDTRWWVFDVGQDADDLAATIGLRAGRSLLQMHVTLPLAMQSRENGEGRAVSTRAFEVGRDETAWLEVNNAAFAWHPEQGIWDIATLRLREQENWFDPSGFLLHERDGRLAAFCWTKLHHEADGIQGEIYVVAVHPDFRGLGLGKALTIAGLDSIAAHGVTAGMLFVDLDNTSAVGLYESLGFHINRIDRAYVGHISGSTTAKELK